MTSSIPSARANALLLTCSRAAMNRALACAERTRTELEECTRACARHDELPLLWQRLDSTAPCPASEWEARLVSWHEQRIELEQQRKRAADACRHNEFIANRARAKHLQLERYLASSSGVRRGE